MIAKCVTEITRRAPIVDAMQIFHIINTHAYFSLSPVEVWASAADVITSLLAFCVPKENDFRNIN